MGAFGNVQEDLFSASRFLSKIGERLSMKTNPTFVTAGYFSVLLPQKEGQHAEKTNM